MTEEVIHAYVSFNSNNSQSDSTGKTLNTLGQKSKTQEDVCDCVAQKLVINNIYQVF